LQKRKHKQVLDLGAEQHWYSNCGRSQSDERIRFAGVVISLKDLSSSIWMWHKDGRDQMAEWKIRSDEILRNRPIRNCCLPC